MMMITLSGPFKSLKELVVVRQKATGRKLRLELYCTCAERLLLLIFFEAVVAILKLDELVFVKRGQYTWPD